MGIDAKGVKTKNYVKKKWETENSKHRSMELACTGIMFPPPPLRAEVGVGDCQSNYSTVLTCSGRGGLKVVDLDLRTQKRTPTKLSCYDRRIKYLVKHRGDMDNVIVTILVLLLALVLQYCWQLYKTSPDAEGVVTGIDLTESVTDKISDKF